MSPEEFQIARLGHHRVNWYSETLKTANCWIGKVSQVYARISRALCMSMLHFFSQVQFRALVMFTKRLVWRASRCVSHLWGSVYVAGALGEILPPADVLWIKCLVIGWDDTWSDPRWITAMYSRIWAVPWPYVKKFSDLSQSTQASTLFTIL